MKILRHPVFLITIGLLAGLATGLGWFWHAAGASVKQMAARRATAAAGSKPGAPWGFWTIEMENLASDLKDEMAKQHKRAEQLDEREARFTAERQELEKVRADIEAQRQGISGRLIEIQALESKNLRTLAQTYTNMAPAAAVEIFRDMDDITVVKILSLMKPDTVAPLLEAMAKSDADPALAKRAATLTEKLRIVKPAGPAGT